MMPVGLTASPKRRPCWMAFCPTVPSSTSSVSCGAPGSRRAITRTTLRSSSISPSWVCSRPAVPTMTVSSPRETAASTASKATAAGSPPAPPPMQGLPRAPRDAGDAQALRPDLQLGDCAGTIGVARREHHPAPLALQAAGELGDGGGLAGPVDAHNQDDRRAGGIARQGSSLTIAVQHGGKTAFQRAPQVNLGLELSLPDLVLQGLGELHGGGHAEIGLDEALLQLFQVVGVEP